MSVGHGTPDGGPRVTSTDDLVKRSENVISDEETLHRELESFREQGTNKGETTPKVWAMASPIIQEDTVYGAVGVAGPKHRMSGDRFTDSMPAKVLEAAKTIELELGYK